MSNFKYRQLADQLMAEIASVHSSPGSKIPTEGELEKRFAVSRNTVRQAVNILAQRGFLTKTQGSGTFVSERITEFLDKRRSSQKNRSIGVVMNQVNAYIFPSVLMGISDYLFENDYLMIIRMTFNQVAKERAVLEELLEADVAGLIIEPARSALPLVNQDLYHRIEQRIPCVLLYGRLPDFSFPSVDSADVEGYHLLVDHLVERGHRDIAAICKLDELTGVGRYQGYATGLMRHGIEVNENRILWYADEDSTSLFSDQNAHRILQTIKNCSAVMCFNDELAAKLLPFLQKRGIRVPEDISVVGFDNLWQNPLDNPVTTIDHAKKELGRVVAKAMVSLLENPFSDVSYVFPPRMIDNHSVLDLTKVEAT